METDVDSQETFAKLGSQGALILDVGMSNGRLQIHLSNYLMTQLPTDKSMIERLSNLVVEQLHLTSFIGHPNI